jgi:hypothetical protein
MPITSPTDFMWVVNDARRRELEGERGGLTPSQVSSNGPAWCR